MAKEVSALSSLIRSRFPGKRFLSSDLKTAGRRMKDGEEAVVAFLEPRQRDSVPNLRPPAFCEIVGMSRPVREWPIYRLSMAVQEHVFSMTEEEFQNRCGGLPSFPSSKEDLMEWMRSSGIEESLYSEAHVQAMNIILRAAAATYKGVIKKVENRNKKRAEKAAARIERGLPVPDKGAESAFGEDGRLLRPPSPNRVVLCWQGISPKPVTDASLLPEEFRLYRREPWAKIGAVREDRLLIPEGEPGHVPEWQRREGLVSPGRGRRRKKWYSRSNMRRARSVSPERARMAALCRAEESFLMQTRIGEDWVAYDVRGLLRNARWRGLALDEDLDVRGLMGLFSGDPVIDPEKNVVTFLYKEGVVDVSTSEVIPSRFAPKALERMCSAGPVALLSLDLGQTNIVAARATAISKGLVAGETLTMRIPERIIRLITSFRRELDELEERILSAARGSLSGEMREEAARVEDDTPEAAASRICAELGIDPSVVPWGEMGPGTTKIAEALRALGRDSETRVDGRELRDPHFARRARLRLSLEARIALNEAIWEAKRGSREYSRIFKKNKEAVRFALNYVVREAKRKLRTGRVAINIEDLNVSSGFFDGRGATEKGWGGLLSRRRENRWLIKAVHGAVHDLARNRGVLVIESTPHRTSITCPECGNCDPENRRGESFVCRKCGHSAHADFDVATRNLERVAISGRPMPARERPGDAGSPRTPRNPRKPEKAISGKSGPVIPERGDDRPAKRSQSPHSEASGN